MSPRILSITPGDPSESVLAEAVSLMAAGSLIAYPTETFYGIGADGMNDAAVERIYAVKGRRQDVPISLIIGDRRDLEPLVAVIPPAGRRLMDVFWPGALTIVFAASPSLPKGLTAGRGTIGIRLSADPCAALLARRLGRPLTATSANRSGGAECATADAVIAALGNDIDAVVDGGRTPGPPGSTIIDVTVDPPVILRKGVIEEERIAAVLRKA